MILENNPDLVITDNQMPKINGIDVIKKINSNSEIIKPAFILVASDTAPSIYAEAKEQGVLNLVNKSSVENELNYAIEEFIYLKEKTIEEREEVIDKEKKRSILSMIFGKK